MRLFGRFRANQRFDPKDSISAAAEDDLPASGWARALPAQPRRSIAEHQRGGGLIAAEDLELTLVVFPSASNGTLAGQLSGRFELTPVGVTDIIVGELDMSFVPAELDSPSNFVVPEMDPEGTATIG